MKSIYQRFVRRTLFVILLSQLAILSNAATYYVSNSGNDSNSGLTTTLAWKTISKVNGFAFAPGDIVSFKGGDTWVSFSPRLSPSVGNITINSYGIGQAEFTAFQELPNWNVSTNWTEYSTGIWRMVLANGVNRLWINDIDSYRCQTLTLTAGSPWRWESGYLYIKSSSNPATFFTSLKSGSEQARTIEASGVSGITFQNIKVTSGNMCIQIYNAPNTIVENCTIGDKVNYNGINVYSSASINNVIIRNNIFTTGDNLTYSYAKDPHTTGDAIQLGNGCTNCKVYGNFISSFSHAAVYMIALNSALPFSGNEVYSNYVTAPTIDYARAFGADTHSASYNNSFHDNTAYNMSVGNQLNSNGLKFYNNIIDGIRAVPYATNAGYGIAISGYASSATNMEIYNNTITNCINVGIAIDWFTGTSTEKAYNNIHDNNLFNNGTVAFHGVTDCQLWVTPNGSSINHNTFANNHFFSSTSSNTAYYAGINLTTSGFNSATPQYNDVISTNDNIIKYGNYTTAFADLRIEHNGTSAAKTVSLSQPMISASGVKYSSTVTLKPFTSIVLMKDLTAAVVPGAPTSVVAAAGNASASVTFVAPISNGGSVITGYSVTSIPAGGIDTNAGSTLLTHTITGLTNGTSYTFTVKATNSVGTSVASAASNSVIPKAPVATGFLFTGPSSGIVNSGSSNFTVTPNNPFTGTITITFTGIGSSGLSAKVLTFSNSSTAQTFTITPTVAGSITLTPSNNGTLTNPANITYTVNAVVPNAPTSVIATSGDASALVNFIAPTNTGGSVITGYIVTSIPAGGIDANAGSTALNHTITGLINGISYTFTVKATNAVGSSVASVASNSVIPTVTNVIIKQGEIIPSHFTTVWQGLNGLNQMNINVVAATLEDIPLSTDDEIAVFSGSACVGASKLTQSIILSDNTTFVTILASQNDGSGNGFNDNDTIVFKIWNNKTQSELQINSVVYHNDISTWQANGRYSPASTAVVEIESYQVYTQNIQLLKGYNLISTYVSAQNPNVSNVTKTLVDQGNLIKMQDETGNSLENWGNFGGWINKLGSLEETEGYKIQVANNCTLQVTGRFIAMPFDITLKTGWNIISFPRTDVVNALNVVQALIDQNKLVKVQDESGNSIENWGSFGGWKNGIGNFIPGKAYKVKMSADAILTFQESYPKSAVVIAQSEQTEYYHSSMEGNGTDHMNINITGLNNIGISVGDELAAFDGATCVATTKITEANLLSGSACLASSFSTNDQNPNGFKVGNPIQISIWNKLSGDESKVNAEVIIGQMKYEKNASVLVKMKSASITTGIPQLDDVVKIDVFPNPCQGRITVRFSALPDANSRIEISDISGRKLITRLISGTVEEFNLDSFTSGLYLVRSILGSNEFVQKLIVNK